MILRNDDQHAMPAYLQAEHGAAILKRAQYQEITEVEVWHARRCLENALAALASAGTAL